MSCGGVGAKRHRSWRQRRLSIIDVSDRIPVRGTRESAGLNRRRLTRSDRMASLAARHWQAAQTALSLRPASTAILIAIHPNSHTSQQLSFTSFRINCWTPRRITVYFASIRSTSMQLPYIHGPRPINNACPSSTSSRKEIHSTRATRPSAIQLILIKNHTGSQDQLPSKTFP